MRPARKIERLIARPFLTREEQAMLDEHLMNEKHERVPRVDWAKIVTPENFESFVVEPPRGRKGRTG